MKKEYIEKKRKDILTNIANAFLDIKEKLEGYNPISLDGKEMHKQFLESMNVNAISRFLVTFGIDKTFFLFSESQENKENKTIVKELIEFIETKNEILRTQIMLLECLDKYEDTKTISLKGTIVITDPCYLISDDTEEDDWAKCEYGNNMEVLGIKNYICHDTLYGDWSCTTFNKDTNEVLGHFCADAGLVFVGLLDEILTYNPKFLEDISDYSTTIIENFDGEITIKVNKTKKENEDNSLCFDNYYAYVEGKGNINFLTAQTGF